MTDLTIVPTWNAAINRLERNEFATGGADGNMNIAPRQLAENVFWLKADIDGKLTTLTEYNTTQDTAISGKANTTDVDSELYTLSLYNDLQDTAITKNATDVAALDTRVTTNTDSIVALQTSSPTTSTPKFMKFGSTATTIDLNAVTDTAIPLNSVFINQGQEVITHSPTENTKITVSETGYYRISFNFGLVSTAERPSPAFRVRRNGLDLFTEVAKNSYIRSLGGHNESSVNASFLISLTANDFIEIVSKKDSSATGATYLIASQNSVSLERYEIGGKGEQGDKGEQGIPGTIAGSEKLDMAYILALAGL